VKRRGEKKKRRTKKKKKKKTHFHITRHPSPSATATAKLDLGTDPGGYGFGGTGKKSNQRQFDDYGEAFGLNDVIGCALDLATGAASFSKNGRDLGIAFTVPAGHRAEALYPCVVLKNAQMGFNFGASPFKHEPPAGYVAFDQAPSDAVVRGGAGAAAGNGQGNGQGQGKGKGKGKGRAGGGGGGVAGCGNPMAMVLEPSRELAEQTYDAMVKFSKNMPAPCPRVALFVGGIAPREQLAQLAAGCDVFVGTPGRVADFLKQGKLSLENLRFFCLDEADRLLDTGNSELIMSMYNRVPRNAERPLQVLLFSATLHSPEILGLTETITQHATWVDLKGKDAVPDTVHFATVTVDPHSRKYWGDDAGGGDAAAALRTDAVHSDLGASAVTADGDGDPDANVLSQRIKLAKPRILVSLLDTLATDMVMVFTRTKVDADNLEAYLVALDGGRKFRASSSAGPEGKYSCVVLHGDRTFAERREGLEAFREGRCRLLICTDVAARGIDITGLPLVVNMTMPDRVEDYFHRCGRVGRADAMGLAVSIGRRAFSFWFCFLLLFFCFVLFVFFFCLFFCFCFFSFIPPSPSAIQIRIPSSKQSPSPTSRSVCGTTTARRAGKSARIPRPTPRAGARRGSTRAR
jgi:ATP-dependent RNA helicase DDX1